MKRHIISIVVVLSVLAVALVALAQQEDSRNADVETGQKIRDALKVIKQSNEAQEQALEIIPEHLAKLSDLLQKDSMQRGQELLREERVRSTEKWQEEWDKAIEDLELQVAILIGPRRPRRE